MARPCKEAPEARATMAGRQMGQLVATEEGTVEVVAASGGSPLEKKNGCMLTARRFTKLPSHCYSEPHGHGTNSAGVSLAGLTAAIWSSARWQHGSTVVGEGRSERERRKVGVGGAQNRGRTSKNEKGRLSKCSLGLLEDRTHMHAGTSHVM